MIFKIAYANNKVVSFYTIAIKDKVIRNYDKYLKHTTDTQGLTEIDLEKSYHKSDLLTY